MLLRVSGQMKGEPIDLRAVADHERADQSGVPGALGLLAFTTSVLERKRGALDACRKDILGTMGHEALVDAAAVIGSFQRMNLVADGTGIPLDPPLNAMSADIQEELGLREFASAGASSKPNRILSTVARWLRPLAFRVMGKWPPKR